MYLIKTGATPTEIKILMKDIIKNDPKELIIVLPNLGPGQYHVEVRTYGDSKGLRLVNDLRTARFKHTIKVEQE